MAVAGLSLEALLKECGVPTEVGTHLSKLNIKSTNLFATWSKTIDDVERFTATCEFVKQANEEVRDEIHAKLRLAWLQAKAALDRSMKRKAEGLTDEVLDSPLDHALQESLISSAVADYKWKSLEGSTYCSDNLLGRFRREFVNTAHTLLPFRKSKTSAAMQGAGGEYKRSRIADKISILFDGLDDTSAPAKNFDLLDWMFAFEYTARSWAIVGNYDVEYVPMDSESLAKKTVRYAHMADLEAYRRELAGDIPCLRKLNTEESVLNYKEKLEEEIRKKAIEFARPPLKYPWGLSLLKACDVKASLWTKLDYLLIPRYWAQWSRHLPSAPPPQLMAIEDSSGGGASSAQGGKADGKGKREPKKKVKKGKQTADGQKVCFKFNGNKGCQTAGCQFKHVCNVTMPSGAICGGSHSRKNHDPAKHGAPKQQ